MSSLSRKLSERRPQPFLRPAENGPKKIARGASASFFTKKKEKEKTKRNENKSRNETVSVERGEGGWEGGGEGRR